MNTTLSKKLATLLHAHVGDAHLRTPLLNRLQVLADSLTGPCLELRALAAGAPRPGAGGVHAAQPMRDASAQYWSDLAPGTELSRQDHARALRAEDLSHRAHVLAAFGEISEAGLQLLADALEPSEQHAAPSTYAVALQTSDNTRWVLPGAEVIQAPVSDRCLLVFPGVGQQLFEFDSRAEVGHGLIEFMLSEHGSEVWIRFKPDLPAHWQSPPFAGLGIRASFGLLKDAVLAYGVRTSIASELNAQINALPATLADWDEQRQQRFWLPLPALLETALAAAIKADGERQAALVTFASVGADIATALVQHKLTACETGIQRYIGDSLASYEHQRYRQIHAAWQAAQGKAQQQIEALKAQAPDAHAAFWTQADESGLTPRQHLAAALGNALRHDAQLQVFEGTLASADLTLIDEVLGYPNAMQRSATGSVVAQIAVGPASFSYRLPGAYVIATAGAWSGGTQAGPCLLFMAGQDGGVRRFTSLEKLLHAITTSLQDPAFVPLWARYSPQAQAALIKLLRQAPVPLVTTPVAVSWLDDYLGTEIDRYQDRRAATSEAAARARLDEELHAALKPAAHEVRKVAIDRIAEQRRLQSALQGLPSWLSGAGESVRKKFAGLLDHYNRVAVAQERYLEREPALIQPFARRLLQSELEARFNCALDPQQILIRLPEAVEVKVVTNVPSEVLVPSPVLQTLTLVELALLNIDRQVTLRLRFATLLDESTGLALTVAGLTLTRLRRLIIELDVAAQYRRQVNRLFSLEADATPGHTIRAQMLAAPYAATLRLQAFCDYQRGLLGQSGWELLDHALNARTAEQLAQGSFPVQMSAVTLNLGTDSVDLDCGLLLFQHSQTSEYWLYLPKVPEGAAFIHGNTLDDVTGALMRRLRSTSMRTWLAGQAGVGQPTASREEYLRQAYERDYVGFMRFSPVTYPVWPVAAALLRSRQQQLLNDARLISRSRAEVRQTFAQQLRDGGKQLALSGLYYLPGIGTALQVYDGWADAQDAVNAFGRGDTALGLRRMASAELNFGFALVSFIPGVAAGKVARTALKGRQAKQGALPHIGREVERLDGFAGHEVAVNLTGAKRQGGVDAGTWKHQGKLYLWQDGKAYEVFRRAGELTLRLRRTPANSHEHPVRRGSDGRFVTHLDTGLRAGGRSRAGSTASAASVDEGVMADYLIAAENRAVMADLLPKAGKYSLDEHGSFGPLRPGDHAKQDFFVKRQKLLRDADAYLRTVTVEPRVEMPTLAENVAHAPLIEAIYTKANGLVVGEAHASAASKRFLIDNFATLKAQGVNTLYFEHLQMDFVANDLKVLNDSGVMTPALSQHLHKLDHGHRVDAGQPYTFHNVVVQANKQGLQVVSLDCAASWYDKGVSDNGINARHRMFSYLASQVIQAHQVAKGEHKWVALVGNSHSNTYSGTLGLAELNKAIGIRVGEPEVSAARWRPDPGFHDIFSRTQVKADFFLEVPVPVAEPRPPSPAASLTPSEEALIADVQNALGSHPPALQPTAPRLRHPGQFYIEKVGGERVVVHLSRDGQIYRTPIQKQLGRYWLSRPSWDKVHERRFWTLRGLLAALAEQNLSHVTS